MIEFGCRCGRRFSLPEAMAGKRGKCPGCCRLFDVPAFVPRAITAPTVPTASSGPRRPLLWAGLALAVLLCLPVLGVMLDAAGKVEAPREVAARPVPIRDAMRNPRVRAILGEMGDPDSLAVGVGSPGVLRPPGNSGSLLLYDDGADLDRVLAAMGAGDADSAAAIASDAALAGHAFSASDGTRVTVIAEHPAVAPTWIPRTRVGVVSGPHSGRSGWAIPWVFRKR